MSTPFDYQRGFEQQRIVSGNAVVGTHVFELGQEGLGEGNVAIGDYHSIEQSLTSPNQLIRVAVRIVEPTDTEVTWDFVCRVGTPAPGQEVYRRRLTSLGRTLLLTEVGLGTIDVLSPTRFEFRLEAVA